MRDIEVLRQWIRVVTLIAAIAATSFPAVYAFFPWRARPLGRVLMLQGVTLAAALNISLILSFVRPNNIMVLFWINAVILTGIAVSTSSLTYMVWKLNTTQGRGDVVLLSGKVYDVMKAVAQVWLPAAGALYFALAQVWGLPSAEQVSGTVLAVDTFLGVILGLSSKTYNAGPKYAADLEIFEGEEGGSNLRINNVDLQAFIGKKDVTFRIVDKQAAETRT